MLAPGKRLRPALALWAAQACGDPHRDQLVHWKAAAPAAIAVECIHAYSLVHDDLPAMDDDDLRRGRPTCAASTAAPPNAVGALPAALLPPLRPCCQT